MKVLLVNSLCDSGSTGRICSGINTLLKSKNETSSCVVYFWGKKNKNGLKISNLMYQKIQALKSRILGNYGLNSTHNTIKLISYIKKFSPDIVHLHNVHDHTVNLKKLFEYLNKTNIKVVWTFHDCWAFTGYCPHFVSFDCEKWKTECKLCPAHSIFSWFLDKSKKIFAIKKECLLSSNIHIVTPSKWLKSIVQESFLKNKPIDVIYNGLDLDLFKYRESDFRKNYHLDNKFLILGVAYKWSYKKGLDVFIELSKQLPEEYQIVLVGTDNECDKLLPKNIISIHRTSSVIELSQLYSTADLFVNPTREEVLGMVNLESLACGTPVVMFNTNGSPECVDDSCGIVVEKDDFKSLINSIIQIKNKNPFTTEKCREFARAFDYRKKYEEYYSLYLRITKEDL